MKRVALSIGCDAYSFLCTLSGAESDAKTMHDILLCSENGDYDHEHSILLISPLLNQVREALQRILFESGKIDTFTFFFAGHGGVKAGSYYLCVAESQKHMISTSAFGMTDLFSAINEAQPRHSNIILDACQAGGIVADLHSVLKPELVGGAQTPGMSIFASSAADQYSAEDDAGGIGTMNLLSCINGKFPVQAARPTLDLLEVGKVAASLISEKCPGQTPVLWGLNLYGEARFCKNSHYSGITPPVLSLPYISPGTPQHEAIRRNADAIWREYLAADRDFEPRRLLDQMAPVVSATLGDPADAAVFARGIARAFSARAVGSTDVFRGAEVVAACAVALLSRSHEEAIDAAIKDMAIQALDLTSTAIAETADLIKENKYLLLSRQGLFGDLFYLPVRLTRILGWIGTQHFICEWVGKHSAFDDSAVNTVLQCIVDTYPLSLVSVSDVQAPYLLAFLSCCRQRGWCDAAEAIIGHMFNSFVEARGKVAAPSMEPDRVFEFINRRLENRFDDAFTILSQPGELLSVLLRMGQIFELNDGLDPHLHLLDHTSLNVFIPRDHEEFGETVIRNGINNTYEIGREIWTTEEFASAFQKDCLAQIKADASIDLRGVKVGALYAAMLFPDRTPWFIARDWHLDAAQDGSRSRCRAQRKRRLRSTPRHQPQMATRRPWGAPETGTRGRP